MIVRWSPQAELDRLSIAQFIASEDSEAAIRIDERFTRAANRLKNWPYIGRPGAIAGTREIIPHRRYRMVYQIFSDEIWILTIVHTARQWPPEAE